MYGSADRSDSGGNSGSGIGGEVLCFVAVLLGVVTSIALVAWALYTIQAHFPGAMGFSPVALLVLAGHVVRERALQDWYATRSLPLPVRLARVYLIGFSWPLWIKRS